MTRCVVLAAVLLLAGCGAGERDAKPGDRSFEIAVGEVVNIPVTGTNNSARTGPEVVEATGDATTHELQTSRCPDPKPGCTAPTRLRVTGVKRGAATIAVRTCFFEKGPDDCQQLGETVTYIVVVT